DAAPETLDLVAIASSHDNLDVGRHRWDVPRLRAATFAQLAQEGVGWHEERIFLKDSADENQRVGSHDVDNPVTTKSGKIVRAKNRIGSGHEVRARLVLEQDVHT